MTRMQDEPTPRSNSRSARAFRPRAETMEGRRLCSFGMRSPLDGVVSVGESPNHLVSESGGSVNVTLVPPGPPAELQPTATATVVNRTDVVAPKVKSTQLMTRGSLVTGVILTFTEPLEPGSAADTRNYSLNRLVNPPNAFYAPQPGQPIPLKSAHYDATTRTVTLVPARSFQASSLFRVAFADRATNPVTDRAGNPLDTTRYGVDFAFGPVLKVDAVELFEANGSVTLRLTGGGNLELAYDTLATAAPRLTVNGTNPRANSLSATWRGTNKDPVFHLDAIVSAHPFRNRLDPKHFVIGRIQVA